MAAVDLESLPKPFFVLAPMDDVTDTVFRQVIASTTAPDLFFTEFVNVDALQSKGREATLPRLQFTSSEKPLIAQVWGLNPENFYKSAKEIAGMGFDGIDINFGCPIKNVVQNGACSALILPENRGRAVEIISAVREGVPRHFPISVKTRLGFSEIDLSWHELLLKQKLNMLSIHGRTKSQMSKVPADWETIGKIRELRDQVFPTEPRLSHVDGVQGTNEQQASRTNGTVSEPHRQLTQQSATSTGRVFSTAGKQDSAGRTPRTLIVGNGDVMTHVQGMKLAKKHKLDGIMIGRGVLHDPFVFAEKTPWEGYSKKQRLSLYKKHVELFAKTWKDNKRSTRTLNKFCKIYIQGFDGAKELREQLMRASSITELLKIINQYA